MKMFKHQTVHYLVVIIALLFWLSGCKTDSNTGTISVKTFCNPMDLSYRFCTDEPSRREAADPTVVWFRDRYYLFASKSGGYWHSKDLLEWIFIETDQIPIEEYAPTAIAIGDVLYFLASSNVKSTIYSSTNPMAGEWSVAVEELEIPVWDPAFFLDDDNRLYLYWGCSNVTPIYGVEVDYSNGFAFIGEPKELIHAKPSVYGWEVPGDYNTLVNQSPWIEGAWMNKHNGKYYLQYSGPGTEYKSYADGVYVSDNALGPYTLQAHNPFAYKPEGFAAGAGHGSTFTDPHGNYWHVGTITISQKHIFERRLGMFPTFFDNQGTLYSITKYGDYPLIMPGGRVSSFDEVFPGWMLLSYGRSVEVSSSIDTLPPINMVDEDIRTYWAAQTGGANEYATLDMGQVYDVYSLQINFAEHNTNLFGRTRDLFHRYVVEHSVDGEEWSLLIDKSDNQNDNTHDYTQLDRIVPCRYLRLRNISVPDGNFAVSGFRVFGKGNGNSPTRVNELVATRNPLDSRSVTVKWSPSENATGYVISFGVDSSRMYHNYMVYSDTSVTINSLNAALGYYFSIESFNESGITPSTLVVRIE